MQAKSKPFKVVSKPKVQKQSISHHQTNQPVLISRVQQQLKLVASQSQSQIQNNVKRSSTTPMDEEIGTDDTVTALVLVAARVAAPETEAPFQAQATVEAEKLALQQQRAKRALETKENEARKNVQKKYRKQE